MHPNSLNQFLNVPTSSRGSSPEKQLAARRGNWQKRPLGLTEGAKSVIHRHLQRAICGFGDTKGVKWCVLIKTLSVFGAACRESRDNQFVTFPRARATKMSKFRNVLTSFRPYRASIRRSLSDG